MTWKVTIHHRQDWNDRREFYVRAGSITVACARALKAARKTYDPGSAIFVGSAWHKDAPIIA